MAEDKKQYKGRENRDCPASFEQAEEYLNQIPKFAREKHTVEDIQAMMQIMGLSLDGIRVVHVAGTNGKGSVCAFLASALREEGVHTAVFTSPHLVCIRERFCFDGGQVEEEEFLDAFMQVKKGISRLNAAGISHPSYFEYLFLMFAAMMQKRKDFTAVLETGLGGRLDATNAVRNPALCVITSISLDHMEYLGNTVELIAGEKAGIIKPGVKVIFDSTDPLAAEVIKKRAEELNSPWEAVGTDSFSEAVLKNGHLFIRTKFLKEPLEIPFAAWYQAVNAMAAAKAAGALGISERAVREGFRKTGWPGRMEEILPGVYLDGAHNEGGIRAFSKSAAELSGKRKILLFAVVSDKEYRQMAEILLREFAPDVLILTQIAYKRGLDIKKLEEAAREVSAKSGGHRLRIAVKPSVKEAFRTALEEKGEEDTVFCAGSLYLIGEIKDVIRRNHYGERP